jgi:hypothetical protein
MTAPFDHSRGLLRPGITGFGGGPETCPGAPEFKAACMHALRVTRTGRWLATDAPHAGRNHHRALVELAPTSTRLWILLNQVHPLLAFARADDGHDHGYRFIDLPALAAGFHEPFECVPAALLDAPFDFLDTSRRGLLDPTSLQQARYWRPARLGDVVFNHWD